MPNFYKENYYNVGELVAVLRKVPKDYKIQIYSEDFDCCCGKINYIDIYNNEKQLSFWFN